MPLRPIEKWMLGGAGIGALAGLVPDQKNTEREKRRKMPERLFNSLSGAAVGAGLGGLANKGVSNYLANNMGEWPVNYEMNNVARRLKPESIRGFWNDLTTRPTLDSIMSRVEVEPKGRSDSWNVDSIPYRAELLSRGLGVFDDSKGSLYTSLGYKTRKKLDPAVLERISKIPRNHLLEERDPKPLSQSLGSYNEGWNSELNDALGNMSVYSDKNKDLSWTDTWDVGMHPGERLIKYPKGVDSLLDYWRSIKGNRREGISKFLKGSPVTATGGFDAASSGIQWPNIARSLLQNGLLDPVTVVGAQEHAQP